MVSEYSYYSPHILIYLQIGEQRVRLADVLEETATLYDSAEVPPNTNASLVFSIDGIEESEPVVLHQGIARDSEIIRFSYLE